MKIKSVVSFQKDTKKVNFDPGSGVTSKIQTYIFTVSSFCNRRTVVGIESGQYLPYQSM